MLEIRQLKSHVLYQVVASTCAERSAIRISLSLRTEGSGAGISRVQAAFLTLV